MRADVRLAGGSVMLPDGELADVDVLIAGGRISAICAPDAPADVAEVVSVEGLTVLPGAIDAHVHLGQDITVPKTPEDVELETAAAAAGGVTTLLAYLMTPSPYDDVFAQVVPFMEAHAAIDFGLHFCIVTPEQLADVPRYVRELGVSSFKFFMNFRGDEGKYLGLPGNDDGFLLDLLRAAADSGAMVNPHAENVELIWKLREQPVPEGLSPLATWNHLRPAYAEAEAAQRAAYLARVADASMYAVHVTNAESLELLEAQRAAYPSLFLETCPHYLTHDVESDLGTLGKVNPPLRTAYDRETLWRAVADGVIDVIGSDHVPRHVDAKRKDIIKASAGFPGLQTLLPVLLSEGCLKRDIPLARIVDATSAAPARIFGLYPRKGAIAVGADADLAIVDMSAGQTVASETQMSGAGYSIYDGWELGCRVVHTLVRGRFALRAGELSGDPIGRYQRREQSGAAAMEVAR
jgi:dihydropyrimidinase